MVWGMLVAGIGCRSDQLTVEQVVERALEAQEGLNSYHFEMKATMEPVGIEGETSLIEYTYTGTIDEAGQQNMVRATSGIEAGEEFLLFEIYVVGGNRYSMSKARSGEETWDRRELPPEYWQEPTYVSAYRVITQQHVELLADSAVNLLHEEEVEGVVCYALEVKPDLGALWQTVMFQSALGMLEVESEEFKEVSYILWISKAGFFLVKAEVTITIIDDLGKTVSVTEDLLVDSHNEPVSIQVPERGIKATAPVLDSPVVDIPDKNLEDNLRRQAGNYSRPLTVADLESITSLGAQGPDSNVGDLAGLEYCKNLRTLRFYNTRLNDLSPLAGLVNLESLSLTGGSISDLSPLAGLVNIMDLQLWNNEITDLSPLVGLPKLRSLSIEGNPLSSTSIDVYIPQLEERGVQVHTGPRRPGVAFPQ